MTKFLVLKRPSYSDDWSPREWFDWDQDARDWCEKQLTREPKDRYRVVCIAVVPSTKEDFPKPVDELPDIQPVEDALDELGASLRNAEAAAVMEG
jgi:hypothetical protein